MTFAFILGAQKTQTPFCFTKYHRHKNNCSYSQNSPFPSSVVVCFVIVFPSANHTCCAFAHKNSLPNFNHTCSRLPSYSHHKNSHGTAETHLGEPQWKQLRECLSLLPARIFSPLPPSSICSACSVFLPGSGNQHPQVSFWKCCSRNICSLTGISGFGEISEQSVCAQLCQISQMLGNSDKTRIRQSSLQNPPHFWSPPCLSPQSFWPWHENRTEEECGSQKSLLVFSREDSLILLWTVCFSWSLQKRAHSLILSVCEGNKNLNLETS